MTGDALLRQIAGWLDDEVHGIDGCIDNASGRSHPYQAGAYLGRLQVLRDSLTSLRNTVESAHDTRCHTTTYLTAGQRVARCSREDGHDGMHRDGAVTWGGDSMKTRTTTRPGGVCRGCPDWDTDPNQHCAGCGQHLHPTYRPDRWTGIMSIAECEWHPTGYHHPQMFVLTWEGTA